MLHLTPEEREVARGLVRGDSPEALCRKLRISENRMRTNVKHLLEKTATHKRSQLLERLRHDLVEPAAWKL